MQRLCLSCRRWHDKKERACPHCGEARPAANPWLRTAALNAHLNDLRAHAEAEA